MKDEKIIRRLHTGTSGWIYGHWAGIFYPEDIKPAGYLEYYTTKFGCVELNASFYHVPFKATVEGWVRRTPETFRFCPKLSRLVTHRKRLVDCAEPLGWYFDVFREMTPRLGPVLVQLPPGLAFDKPLFSDFLSLLHALAGGYRFAIEARHQSWIADESFSLLEQYGAAWVIADSGRRFPYQEAITADFVYLRFHGHESLYSSDYPDHELWRYAEKIRQWLDNGCEVWVFFNNDFNGYAVKNALKLEEMVNTI
jgi:uncharacterized protein YecE (DUF72 family)